MGNCCGKKGQDWDMNFKETELSSNRCDAKWETIKGEQATFGVGPPSSPCARFGVLPGVIRCRVGFAGGTTDEPNDEDSGDYTLAINLEFDPKVVTYERLLVCFWNYHDIFLASETPANQSTIFYHSDEQKETAKKAIGVEQEKHTHEIMTQIKPFTTFVASSDEHQHFILQSNEDVMWLLENRLFPKQMAHSHLAARLEGYVAGYATLEAFDKERPDLYISDQVAVVVKKLCEKNQVPEAGADRMNDWG